MRYVIIFLFLCLSLVWSEENAPNLPVKFVSVVSAEWVTENGKKVKLSQDDLEIIQKDTLYYNNGNIWIKGHKRYRTTVYGRSLDEWVPATNDIYIQAEGSFIDEKVSGKVVVTEKGDWLRGKFIGKFSGAIENSKLHIVFTHLKVLYYDYKVLHTKHGSGTSKFGRWKNGKNDVVSKGFEHHFVFKLPINQPQSSQVLIPDELGEGSESLPTEEPVATLPKVELSGGISAESFTAPAMQESETTASPQPTDPCKDPALKEDEAMQEYCRNRAYNAKLAAEEEAEKRKREEADAKAEAEYEAEMEKWKKEEEEYNRKLKKELDAQTRAWRKAWKAQDKAFNESIARDQATRRAVQAEIAKAHKIVNRFGGDIERQRLAHKKIDKLADFKNINKAKKIKSAIRKQFYDSKQISLQGKAEYQNAKSKELGKKATYLNTVKETSLAANKLLAKVDPTGLSDKIVEVQEHIYDAVDVVDKKGWESAGDVLLLTNKILTKFDPTGKTAKVVDMQEKIMENIHTYNEGGLKGLALKHTDAHTYGLVSTAVSTGEAYRQYHTKGIPLRKDEVYYDAKGKQLKKVKAGTKVYDQNGHEVTFSFSKRIGKDLVRLAHENLKEESDTYKELSASVGAAKDLQEGYNKGDLNKMVGAGIELHGSRKTVEDATEKVLNKAGVE